MPLETVNPPAKNQQILNFGDVIPASTKRSGGIPGIYLFFKFWDPRLRARDTRALPE